MTRNETALTFRDAAEAIRRERERRHWTIQQWKEDAPDAHWPTYIADTRKAADDAADWLIESLRMLRDAWNAHFESCPTPALNVPSPTWDELQAWANAPSGTASA